MISDHMAGFHDRISIDPAICGGKPCIKGTRLRVHDVLDLLASGASREEILEDYPYIANDDITAAIDTGSKQAAINRYL